MDILGLGELFRPSSTPSTDRLQQLKVFPGHVVDICLDEKSKLYQSPRDIGRIRFRDLTTEYNKPEGDLNKIAYPLDRFQQNYPYPGEEVIIFRAFGETSTTSSPMLANIYYYMHVVSVHHNITSNISPFVGVSPNFYKDQTDSVPVEVAKGRFLQKVGDPSSVKNQESKSKSYRQLRPREGDVILQGRFGTSIRFGSTGLGGTNQPFWADPNNPSQSGDGILLIRADRSQAKGESDLITDENLLDDDCLVVMTTSQQVPIEMASSKLKSWNYTHRRS